jgi:hypothetical protein
MTVIELHPEDLIDKHARGELTADERHRLDAHLERCSACRAEQVLRADFADDVDGEDRTSAMLNLVTAALVTAPAAVRPPATDHDVASDRAAVPSLRPRPFRTALALLVAAALLGAGAAGASGVTARLWRMAVAPQELDHETVASASAAPTLAAKTVSSAARSPARPMEEATAVDAEPAATAQAPAVLPSVPDAPAIAPAPERSVAFRPAAAVLPSSAHAHPAFLASPPESAGSLFESANRARRSGDIATALASYDALERQFPNSREASATKETTGRLLLDRGDPAGALARFDAYLASGSTELREEAMAGRATALERLGRDEDEARAWAALLAAFPRTPYAAHARARVGRTLPQ